MKKGSKAHEFCAMFLMLPKEEPMKKMLTAGLLLVAAGSMACLTDAREYEGYNEQEWEVSNADAFFGNVTETNMALSDASLSGDMGTLNNFDHTATARGYEEGNFAMVDVLSEGDDGAAMQMLTFEGGLDVYEPGQRYVYKSTDFEDNQVSSTNCVGQEPGYWDADEAAEEVAVEMNETEVDEVYTVSVETTGSQGDVATGEFLLDRR